MNRLLTLLEAPSDSATSGVAQQLRERLQWLRTRHEPEGTAAPEAAAVALRDQTARMQQLAQYAPVALALCDRELRYVCVSQRWREEFAAWGDSVIGQRLDEQVPNMPNAWRRNLGRGVAGEVVQGQEERVPWPDGTVRWLHWEVRPLRDAANDIAGIVIFTENITARKRVELALRESEELFHAVADNIPQLAWMTDASGNILWFNRRWLEYTGATVEQIRSEGWEKVHHPEFTRAVLEKWNRKIAAGEPWEDAFPLRHKNGDYRWFLSRAFPIRDAQGKITRWFGTNTDVTQLRQTEEALKRAHAELQDRANALEAVVAERTARLQDTVHDLEAFSYSLSHDMRAPLRAMRGFAQILESTCAPQLNAQAQDYLHRIAAAAARLDQLIQDVLTYSRLAREPVELRAIDLDRMVRQLIEENPALQPPQADVQIEGRIDAVLGHEASLMQVVSNLVYNAVKFVTPGQQPQVRIWSTVNDQRVTLYVRDNGIGILEHDQERIFQMFQRLHAAHEYEGTGIGLAIVRKAVDRMGGVIGVDSTLGVGSTFWVQLGRP